MRTDNMKLTAAAVAAKHSPIFFLEAKHRNALCIAVACLLMTCSAACLLNPALLRKETRKAAKI
jgi:hypothetical protein